VGRNVDHRWEVEPWSEHNLRILAAPKTSALLAIAIRKRRGEQAFSGFFRHGDYGAAFAEESLEPIQRVRCKGGPGAPRDRALSVDDSIAILLEAPAHCAAVTHIAPMPEREGNTDREVPKARPSPGDGPPKHQLAIALTHEHHGQ